MRPATPSRHLDPGTYTIQIEDKATPQLPPHRAGVDKATDIEATRGDRDVHLERHVPDGRYHFQCDPHGTTMFGDFTVGRDPAARHDASPPPRRRRPRCAPGRSARASGSPSRARAPR